MGPANDKTYNNIFVGRGTDDWWGANSETTIIDYCLYYHGAQTETWGGDDFFIVQDGFDPGLSVVSLANGVDVTMTAENSVEDLNCPLFDYDYIGVFDLYDQGIENMDGSPMTVDKDLFGNDRDLSDPTVGPFEDLAGTKTYRLIVGPDYDLQGAVPSTDAIHEAGITARMEISPVRTRLSDRMLVVFGSVGETEPHRLRFPDPGCTWFEALRMVLKFEAKGLLRGSHGPRAVLSRSTTVPGTSITRSFPPKGWVRRG